MGFEGPRNFFFFEPNLRSLLAAGSSCPLAAWLCATWSKSVKWEVMLSRTADFHLCGRVDRIAKFAYQDTLLIGLLDEKEPAQTRVLTSRLAAISGELTLFATAGEWPLFGSICQWLTYT